jgi:dethiobiotin synthetase
MASLFITGSGTDIGKTFVACRLIAALPAHLRIRCLKPVVSGYEPGRLQESDPGRLLAALGMPVDAANIARISPWRFRAPLSVDMAAAREGKSLPFADLIGFCQAETGSDLLLIEGVGGVMAPLDDRHTVLDWMAALQAPVVLVVGSYLGSLSHTLTAIRAIEARGLTIAAIVISQSADEPVATAETATTLRRFVGQLPVLGLPRHEDAGAEELAGVILDTFDLA